jgi:AcrR family transcriptional regulator
MSPKADVSAERKQQIYQAAMTCFNRNGYFQTTMDDIVAESGLSKGTLYWYFDSKKELFLALLGDFLEPLGREWDAIVADKAMSATEKLLASLAIFRNQLTEMVDFFAFFMEAMAQTSFDEDVRRVTREFYKPYLKNMDSILQEGIDRGEFHSENVQATSAVILSMFDGLTLALGTGIIDDDPYELLDAAETLVLHGLRVEG